MPEMLVAVFPVWICQKAQEMAQAPAVPLVCGWTGGVNQDMAAIPFLTASKEEEGRALSRAGGHGDLQEHPLPGMENLEKSGRVWEKATALPPLGLDMPLERGEDTLPLTVA